MKNVFDEIKAERKIQDKRFGTSFDDSNTPYNWAAFIGNYATRNLIGDPSSISIEKFRSDMVKVAALAVAAVEATDRKATK